MNKFFLAVVLFLLTFALCALSQPDIDLLLKQAPIEFQPFAHKTEPYRIWDFSNPYHYENWLEVGPGLYIPTEPDGFNKPYNSWYMDDFSKDPFDGKIDIYVMGEPLPSEWLSVCIAVVFAGIILWRRSKTQPT